MISFIVSTSRLSYWTTTRSGIVARSIGAMSMSGAAVTSMPPEWIERWRGKPSMRAHSSSQRSQSDRPRDACRGRGRLGRAAAATLGLRRHPHDRVAAVRAHRRPARAPSAGRPRSRRPGRRRRRLDVRAVDGPVERARARRSGGPWSGRTGAAPGPACRTPGSTGMAGPPVPGPPVAPALLLAARRPLADPAHAHRGVAGAALVVLLRPGRTTYAPAASEPRPTPRSRPFGLSRSPRGCADPASRPSRRSTPRERDDGRLGGSPGAPSKCPPRGWFSWPIASVRPRASARTPPR